MWYNEGRNCGATAVLEYPVADNRKVTSTMDNTIPQNTPQDNRPRKKVVYDGAVSARVNSRINRTGNIGAHHQDYAVVIYGLADPRDSSIFYIGLTDNLYQRFKQHLLMSDNNERKQARIQDILNAHMLPWMVTLEVVSEDASPREREIAHIQAYVQAGVTLLNDEVISLEGK